MQRSAVDGRTLYRINVEPEETLGHYSDWLRLGGVESIRALNGFDASQYNPTGDALLMPVKELGHKDAFERPREENHQVVVDE